MAGGVPHGQAGQPAHVLISPDGRRGFITANTAVLPVPLVREVKLHLAEETLPLWKKTETELGEIGLPPPFWAFAWAGGQALARYILDHPDSVSGKQVIDLASGSGLVAIAAMQAGAASVVATDIDPFAVEAISINAHLNGVQVTAINSNLIECGLPNWPDVILVGDLFYDRSIAASLLGWLRRAAAAGTGILIGDPGRSYLPRNDLQAVASYTVPTSRELEDSEFKRASVWTLHD